MIIKQWSLTSKEDGRGRTLNVEFLPDLSVMGERHSFHSQ